MWLDCKTLFFILLLWDVSSQAPPAKRCQICKECLPDRGDSSSSSSSSRAAAMQGSMPAKASRGSFGPAMQANELLPFCEQCQGCNTQLTSIKAAFNLYNNTFSLERPMSSSSTHVFHATSDILPSGQKAVVKVFCVPLAVDRSGSLASISQAKSCSDRAYKRSKLVLALIRIGQDCGMSDILTKTWVNNVTGVMPNEDGEAGGRVISWLGLWTERAPGLSLRTFLSDSQLHPRLVMDIMHNKLNSTQVVLSAIFDVLTSQRDRHTKNIFIQDNGQIKLIDIEDALGLQWTYWGTSSVLIPMSQRHEAIRSARGKERLAQLLDYRCQLGNPLQELGTNYPPAVSKCLNRIVNKSLLEVQEFYQIPSLYQARTLQRRAKDMLTRGFEWTYQYGEPRNYPLLWMLLRSKPPAPLCCQFEWTEEGGLSVLTLQVSQVYYDWKKRL